eukprot:2076354-Pleurochrysis_carterae.AAC.2
MRSAATNHERVRESECAPAHGSGEDACAHSDKACARTSTNAYTHDRSDRGGCEPTEGLGGTILLGVRSCSPMQIHWWLMLILPRDQQDCVRTRPNLLQENTHAGPIVRGESMIAVSA